MKKIKTPFRILALAAFMVIAFSACKKDNLKNCDEYAVTACSEDPHKTNLRIKNNSKYDFCNVVVGFHNGHISCGIMKAGDLTCYRAFDTVYSYVYVHLCIEDKEFVIQPYDFLGELMGEGKFTYLLDITDYDAGRMEIVAKEDE